MTASAGPVAVAQRLRDGMAGGVLSFPLTAFRDDGTLDADGYRAYVAERLAAAPGAFFTALRDDDHGTLDKLLRDFYVPLVELRDRVPGYAVSLVKAAARLRGHGVGPVRAPLTDPSAADLAALTALLTAGLDLVGATL
ncbi:dihydrodipicolinate synthase/N-acetylneuraminate lyase [Streptomyces sp. AK010]|nr:hypothetical protein [Streptomyces sp. AK010]MBB6419782.1 dihydrodipicolinate synthase/N-acetylneuraminate lyase [Streptomyces sp. AK010]